MKLYKHQQQIVDLNPEKHLLAWETGTGKTIAAIELSKKSVGLGLVIVPKSLKQQWLEQVGKPHFVNLKIYTKEEFRRDWDKLPFRNCLIIDECHYFSGIKSQMHKSLIAYVKKHKPQYIYLLTATPYLSQPTNILCLANILGYNWNYRKFRNTFYTDIRMGSRIIPMVKKNIEPKIAKLVNHIGNTVKLQDCVDVPDQIFEQEYFDLTKEQEEAIEGIEKTKVNHIAKWVKIHQICGGTLKGDKNQYFDCEKLERLKDICDEQKKVVIVCRYNAEVEMISNEIFNSVDKRSVFTLTGYTKDKHEMIKGANFCDEVILVINAACCEGYELPTFDLMVFYSYDFSLKNYIQMRGRIQRINHIKKNVYLSLITKGTIDEDVKVSIDRKEDFDIEIYEKQKQIS